MNFPLMGLDMAEWICKEAPNYLKDSAIYDLYAVVNHVGGLMGGHYTSFCRFYFLFDRTNTYSNDKRIDSSINECRVDIDGEAEGSWTSFDDEVVQVCHITVVS